MQSNWYILAFSWGQQRILKTKVLNVMINLSILLMKRTQKIYILIQKAFCFTSPPPPPYHLQFSHLHCSPAGPNVPKTQQTCSTPGPLYMLFLLPRTLFPDTAHTIIAPVWCSHWGFMQCKIITLCPHTIPLFFSGFVFLQSIYHHLIHYSMFYINLAYFLPSSSRM